MRWFRVNLKYIHKKIKYLQDQLLKFQDGNLFRKKKQYLVKELVVLVCSTFKNKLYEKKQL